MKKWLWIPILIILFFLYCCQTQEKVEQKDIAKGDKGEQIAAIAQTIGNDLDLATESLEKGQLGDATGLLLDSVLLIKPHDRWPEGFTINISSAKEHFSAGNFTDAVGYVSKALKLIKQPDDIKHSTEGGEIAPLAAIVKGKIAEAKDEFKKGNEDQGVIAILEALQLFGPRTD